MSVVGQFSVRPASFQKSSSDKMLLADPLDIRKLRTNKQTPIDQLRKTGRFLHDRQGKQRMLNAQKLCNFTIRKIVVTMIASLNRPVFFFCIVFLNTRFVIMFTIQNKKYLVSGHNKRINWKITMTNGSICWCHDIQ